jgi:hypothetical protein
VLSTKFRGLPEEASLRGQLPKGKRTYIGDIVNTAIEGGSQIHQRTSDDPIPDAPSSFSCTKSYISWFLDYSNNRRIGQGVRSAIMNLAPPVIPPRARSRPAGTRRTDRPDLSVERKGSAETIDSVEYGVGGKGQEDVGVNQDAGKAGLRSKSEPEGTTGRIVNSIRQHQPQLVEDHHPPLPAVIQLQSPTIQSSEKLEDRDRPVLDNAPGPEKTGGLDHQRYSILSNTTIKPDTTPTIPQEPVVPSCSTEKRRKPSASSLVIPERSTSRSQPPSQPRSESRQPPTSTTVSPFSSPQFPDGFETPTEPYTSSSLGLPPGLQPNHGNAFQPPALRTSRSNSSDLEVSSMTTGTSGFPSPAVTPPYGSPFNGAPMNTGANLNTSMNSIPSSSSGSSSHPDAGHTHLNALPKLSSRNSSSSFFKRPYPVLPSSSSASIHSVSSAHQNNSHSRGSTTPSLAGNTSAAGYVNARLAREEERKAELELKREKENKEKERIGVVKDGYKIVDGVEKKRSTSGVYTRKSASSI